MKKYEIIFSIIKIPLDFFILIMSFFIARNIRLITDLIPWVNLPIKTIETEGLFYFSIFWAFLYIFLFATHSLYSTKITNSKVKEFIDIIRYSIYWFVFFSVAVYLWKWIVYTNIEIPRLIIGFTLLLSMIFVILERVILNSLQNYLISKDIIPRRKLLLINNKKSDLIKPILKDIKNSNIYKIIWYSNKEDIDLKKIKYLGSFEKIQDLVENNKCDEILYIDSKFSKEELFKIWELAKIFWIRYRYITNSFDVTKTNTTISLINKIPVLEIKNTPLDSWWRVSKRFMDIVWSIIAIIFFSPIMIIVAILIKIDDKKWPIIYKNRRIWQNRNTFNLYKFRYLKWKYCIKDSYWVSENDDKALEYEKELIKKQSSRTWPLYKIKNDPRKTKIWTFIEKYSIDELPQFFNVLFWEMSIVWPRPHQPREVKKYELYQKRLLTIKPWITWMAQVNGREKNNFVKEAKLDIFYIENWNILLDLKIILKTFNTILKRK